MSYLVRTALIGIFSIAAIFSVHSAAADQGFLRSLHDLEDPLGYCLDVPGFGPNLRKDAPISTHSCKYGIPGFWVDEVFELTDSQQLRLPEYDLCLSGASMSADAVVNTVDCSADRAHGWRVLDNGRVSPIDNAELCLTLASEKDYVNTPENTLPYSSRDISLQTCTSENAYHQAWRWAAPDEKSTYSANTLRSGMTNEIRQQLAALGRTVNPQGTQAIYQDVPRQFSAADVTVTEDISYGPNENNRLRVYLGNNRNYPGGTGAPVLILVHGGGYVRGNPNELVPVATHFAGLGYVVVNMTYPLAPDHPFPAGAVSVGMAVDWTAENIAEYNGDSNRIFVMGHSAGANHVANYVFRPSLMPADTHAVAGAILASPASLTADPQNPGTTDLAYLGEDVSQWSDKILLDNIERSSIPVLVAVAEFDPPTFLPSVAQLVSQLANEHHASPRFRQIPDHGHISYVRSIGTTDRLFTEEVLDFIATAGNN